MKFHIITWSFLRTVITWTKLYRYNYSKYTEPQALLWETTLHKQKCTWSWCCLCNVDPSQMNHIQGGSTSLIRCPIFLGPLVNLLLFHAHTPLDWVLFTITEYLTIPNNPHLNTTPPNDLQDCRELNPHAVVCPGLLQILQWTELPTRHADCPGCHCYNSLFLEIWLHTCSLFFQGCPSLNLSKFILESYVAIAN